MIHLDSVSQRLREGFVAATNLGFDIQTERPAA
jgi:hypothetical protein